MSKRAQARERAIYRKRGAQMATAPTAQPSSVSPPSGPPAPPQEPVAPPAGAVAPTAPQAPAPAEEVPQVSLGVPCGYPGCAEVLATPMRAGRHRLDVHGIRGSKRKRGAARNRDGTRVPPPQRPVVDRPPTGPGPDLGTGAPPGADGDRPRPPRSADEHRRRVEETKAWLSTTGNEWLVRSHQWVLCPDIPEEAFKPEFRLTLTGADGSKKELSLYEQITVQGWQLDFLAEGYVRVEDSELGHSLKVWVERNMPWLFIGGAGAVVVMHLVALLQLRSFANQLGQIRKDAQAAMAAGAGAGAGEDAGAPGFPGMPPGTDVSQLLGDLMGNPEMMAAAMKMGAGLMNGKGAPAEEPAA